MDEGGFRKATEKLNYTQSTITFQISQMEQELSVRLFEKVGRRMALTKAGEWLIPYADEILQSVDKLRYFEDDLSKCRGDIQIGIGETLLSPAARLKRIPQAGAGQHGSRPFYYQRTKLYFPADF